MRNRAAAATPAERAVARRIVSHGHDAFHYSRESAALDIFRRITQDITNKLKKQIDYLAAFSKSAKPLRTLCANLENPIFHRASA